MAPQTSANPKPASATEPRPKILGPRFRQLVLATISQWWALAFGLAACFLVLVATKQLGSEIRVFCALGAIVVILMWLATGGFRQDGFACAASSTLALLPIAALECGWIVVEERSFALLVETFCLAILFVGQVERVGKEAIAMFRHELQRTWPERASLVALLAAPGSRVVVVRCCVILLGLLVLSPTVGAMSGADWETKIDAQP